jgi:hypothetical protein
MILWGQWLPLLTGGCGLALQSSSSKVELLLPWERHHHFLLLFDYSFFKFVSSKQTQTSLTQTAAAVTVLYSELSKKNKINSSWCVS